MDSQSIVKILLVEDDKDDYFIIKDYLSDTSLKYEIIWANNYEVFLSYIGTIHADLVITDYLLGSISGIEVLKKVKESNPMLPVMILTGKGNTDIDMEAMKLGAADYLIKGNFDSSSLERAVRYALERANTAKVLKENEHYQNTLNKLVSTGRMARMIAHEVKNPLTNILLCTDQMNELVQDHEELLSYVEIITRNSKRIDQLIVGLLDSTRFGDIKLEKRNLVEVVTGTLSLAIDRIKLKSIELKESYSHPVIDVLIDEDKIKIALLNIIINAVEALETQDTKGRIDIKVVKDERFIRIHILDNGPGMSEETKEKLFEPFFTSKAKGSGLGLASAQNIVLSHKGRIEVKSKIQEGTEFIISLTA
jgi:signal transduction histidine kinase